MIKKYVIRINNFCNLNCEYCAYKNNKEKEKKEIDVDWVVSELVKKEGDLFVTILGGEPLLSLEKLQELLEKLDKIEKIKMFSITTNGTIFNEEIKNLILKYKNKLSIAISHDGKHLNTRIKNNNLKEKIESNILKFKEVLLEENISIFCLAEYKNVKNLYSNYVYLKEKFNINRFRFFMDHKAMSSSKQNHDEYIKLFCKELLLINREMYTYYDKIPLNKFTRLYGHLLYVYNSKDCDEFKRAINCTEKFTINYNNEYEECSKKKVNLTKEKQSYEPCITCGYQKNKKSEILKKNIDFIKGKTEEIIF